MEKTPEGPSQETRPMTNKEAARLIARGDQLGYHFVNVDGQEVLQPVNLELQLIFEKALSHFSQSALASINDRKPL